MKKIIVILSIIIIGLQSQAQKVPILVPPPPPGVRTPPPPPGTKFVVVKPGVRHTHHYRKGYYYKNGKECDFILFHKEKALPIHVAYTVDDPDTHARELTSLIYTCQKVKSKKGIIITTTPKQNQKMDNIMVHYVNPVEWMLGDVAIDG